MSEAALHKAVAEYLGWVLKPPFFWTTIGHGGGGKVRGAHLKGLGLKAGLPDIMVFAPGAKVLGIELKTEIGRQSPEQRQVELQLGACGVDYAICRSVVAVQGVLEHWRADLRRAAA